MRKNSSSSSHFGRDYRYILTRRNQEGEKKTRKKGEILKDKLEIIFSLLLLLLLSTI